MIQLKNVGTLSTPVSLPVGTTVLPFDTLVCNTNNKTAWNGTNNAVAMRRAGRYNTACTAVIVNTAASTVTLALLANGTPIQGDFVALDITGAGNHTLTLDVPVLVQAASGADSSLQWAITTTSALTLANALASVQAIS